MKKIAFLLLCCVVIGILVLWLRPAPPSNHGSQSSNPERSAVQKEAVGISTQSSNSRGGRMPPKVEAKELNPSDSNVGSGTGTNLSYPLADVIEGQLKDLVVPIEFFGKILDLQSGNPIEGATVEATWIDFTPPDGGSNKTLISDQSGAFSISGVQGRSLGIQVSKKDYLAVRTNRSSFVYADLSSSEVHRPAPLSPVMFYLRKKGAGVELVTSQRGMAPELVISGLRDGSTKRVDFFSQKIGGEGQMELSAVKPLRGQPVTADGWSFRMTIPDGGFVEHSDEFPFEAPESGYQPVVAFHFKPGTPTWTERIDKQFYIVFGTPRRYGRIRIRTEIDQGAYLGYAINPDGSRNLEPK